MKAVKILHTIVQPNEPHSIVFDEPLDSEALVLFNPNGTYEEIFGEKKKDTSQARQRLSVVKITKWDRTIYRQYLGKSFEGLDTNSIGLSPNAWQQLGLDASQNKEVNVTKGCLFPFYWYHSNSATRVSFRMGIIAIAISIIGIILPFVIG